MENLEQAVQSCAPIERSEYISFDDQLQTASDDFFKKNREVSSRIPLLGVNSKELQNTINTMLENIQADSLEACADIASIINEATQSLSSQELVDKYSQELKTKLASQSNNQRGGLFGGYASRTEQLRAQETAAGL